MAWTPLLTPDDVRSLVQETEAELAELEAKLKAHEDGGIEQRVGNAMVQMGWGATQMMKAWDKNKDGMLQRVEFRTAMRSSLGLQASNIEMCAPRRPAVVSK